MREWALDRWPENAQVELSSELYRMKAEIKIEREIEEEMKKAAQLARGDAQSDHDEVQDLAAEYAILQDFRARAVHVAA